MRAELRYKELCLTSQTPPLIPSLEAVTPHKEPLSCLSESCLNPFHAESVKSDLKASVDIKKPNDFGIFVTCVSH